MDILHIDSELLIINKPAGLPVLPDGWDKDAPYLVKLLEADYGNPSTLPSVAGQGLWIVHRLDKTTSGVMVFARSAEAHRELNRQFERHEVKKVYHALAEGNPKWDEHTARHPLRADVGHKHRTIVDDRAGKPSVTHFRVLERFGSRYISLVSIRAGRTSALLDQRNDSTGETDEACLLEAIPETGRTHQVRVHASELGHPLLGDPAYGSGVTAIISRPALHASALTIVHPANGKTVTFTAPYPEDFGSALQKLRGRESVTKVLD